MTLLAKQKESLMTKSLLANGCNNGTRNLASLYDAVPIADRIGLNLGTPLFNGLCTFALPYKRPGFVPHGCSFQ